MQPEPAAKATLESMNVIKTALASAHRQAGARMGVWFGSALPDDFGDWQREYWFAHKSVALIDKNYRAYFSFTGPDRVRYLNAILTNNIKDLAPNHGTISLLLNPQGRILAELETYRTAEGRAEAHPYICVSYAMIRQRLAETLEKFIIMDDVTLTDETDRWGTLALEGPGATQLVQQLTGVDLNSLEELARTPAIVQGSPLQKAGATQSTAAGEPTALRGGEAIPCVVTRRSPGEHPGAEFLVGREHLQALWALLENETTKRGGGPIGYSALSALRLEQGIPWFGYDFGEKQIPHEAALELSHISYTKGCYTGQEIVERVRSRGQVNRRRVNLRFSGERVPVAGEILSAEGKEVGFVTRAAYSPTQKTAIGMGYVRRDNNAPGSQLQWKEGAVEVVASFEANLSV